MSRGKSLSFGLLFAFLIPTAAMAQGFGDYGRTLGGATQRHGSVSPNTSGALPHNGRGKSEEVRDIGGATVPSRLIVVAKNAILFPRQDDQAEKITSLSQGEILVPVLQAVGGNDWYMVKTERGLIGWVKSSDVREESTKKP